MGLQGEQGQTEAADFGVLGLGVMGQNLALNVERNGWSVAVWNRELPMTQQFLDGAAHGRRIRGTQTPEEFVRSLAKPRKILIMVKAGPPVDWTVAQLRPFLEPGDILVDGGNSHFEETRRRDKELSAAGLHFIGSGVSGGETGALWGPSLMPGGAREAYDLIRPIWEAIAAKVSDGPCVTYVGPDGAGHFVKMIHNGIEYGDMQLIAEAYDLLRRAGGLSAAELAEVFARWNEGPLQSYLIEITAQIFKVLEPQSKTPLVDLILDTAGQKGTGRWTGVVALDLGVAIPTIHAAIEARVLSSMKKERVRASALLSGPGSERPTLAAPAPGALAPEAPASGATASRAPASEGQPQASALAIGRQELIEAVHDALYASKICSYAQGMALIRAGSDSFGWGIDLAEMARIWKGGCIIRALFLDDIQKAFRRDAALPNLMLDPEFAAWLNRAQGRWRQAVALAQAQGIPVLAMASSLAYFDSYRTPSLPQNLTQAQRDYFGAHTYERVDKPELGAVHTDWAGLSGKEG